MPVLCSARQQNSLYPDQAICIFGIQQNPLWWVGVWGTLTQCNFKQCNVLKLNIYFLLKLQYYNVFESYNFIIYRPKLGKMTILKNLNVLLVQNLNRRSVQHFLGFKETLARMGRKWLTILNWELLKSY